MSKANEIVSCSKLSTEITEGQYFPWFVLKNLEISGNFISIFADMHTVLLNE